MAAAVVRIMGGIGRIRVLFLIHVHLFSYCHQFYHVILMVRLSKYISLSHSSIVPLILHL